MISRIQHWFGNGWMGIVDLLMTAFCVFLSLSIHEFAHGLAAYKLGDNTAKYMGRLNLSPASHLDPIGAICLFLFGFGWAKPVPVNPNNFKPGKRKSGMVITSLAGPLSNLLVAFVALLLLRIIERFLGGTSYFVVMLATIIVIMLTSLISMNIGLAIFNLMPVPPLDGSKILNAALPARIYFKIMQYEQYGFIILILLLNLPIFNSFLNMIASWILRFYDLVIGLIPFL